MGLLAGWVGFGRAGRLAVGVAAVLVCGSVAGRSRADDTPEPPVYLDCAEGMERLEESRSRGAFATLAMYGVSQETQTFCGVASATMGLNALVPKQDRPSVPEWAPYRLFVQSGFFTPAVRKIAPREVVLERGMTLAQLGAAMATFPVVSDVRSAAEGSEDAFRKEASRTLAGGEGVVIANFLRTRVGQAGAGHFSPLAAYHEKTDSFLVYDVARYKYPPAWIKTKDLWDAMRTVDPDSKATRGYLVVRKRPRPGP